MNDYIVIIGATSGIGELLTLSFANSGHQVIAIGTNQEKLYAFQKNHKNIVPFVIDIGIDNTSEQIALYFESLQQKIVIKYLIHCAARLGETSLLNSVNKTDWQYTFNVNVTAPVFIIQGLIPYYNDSSRILLLGSDYASLTKIRPKFGMYAASKSALRTIIEYYRHEKIATIGYLKSRPNGYTHVSSILGCIKRSKTAGTIDAK